jgi:alkylation response protein AidB-like acyl-CoA dehydrogenase
VADFGDDTEAFRAEARAWLGENFPKSLVGVGGIGPQAIGAEREPTPDDDLWRQRMGEVGWGVPTWPQAYGGGGLSQGEAVVLREEMNRIGAWNPIGGMGVMMFGPTLLEYGTEEQKKRHLPPICRGELRWCQGFSEPGAGSDLAGLSTKAEDKGDHFLVNGQKIWTSGAQYADWCFCLVRTDQTRKHEGISFLLIDMRTPGVDPRPIKLISGASPFCETFFTDVQVPKDNLVPPLNGGWTIAKRLLQHERNGIGSGAATARADPKAQLPNLAKSYVGVDEQGRIADHDLRQRVIDYEMLAKAFQQTLVRAAAEARGSNRGPTATTSIIKNVGSFLRRDGAELTMEIMGHQGIGWEGEAFTPAEIAATRLVLSSKAGGIAGGSQEVQWNIISRRILGLPDPNKENALAMR